jgi:hypothetical protein
MNDGYQDVFAEGRRLRSTPWLWLRQPNRRRPTGWRRRPPGRRRRASGMAGAPAEGLDRRAPGPDPAHQGSGRGCATQHRHVQGEAERPTLTERSARLTRPSLHRGDQPVVNMIDPHAMEDLELYYPLSPKLTIVLNRSARSCSQPQRRDRRGRAPRLHNS